MIVSRCPMCGTSVNITSSEEYDRDIIVGKVEKITQPIDKNISKIDDQSSMMEIVGWIMILAGFFVCFLTPIGMILVIYSRAHLYSSIVKYLDKNLEQIEKAYETIPKKIYHDGHCHKCGYKWLHEDPNFKI